MQDIVFKRSLPVTPSVIPQSEPIIPEVIATKQADRVLRLAASAAANFQRLAAPETRRFVVRQAARHPQLPSPSVRPHYQLPSLPKLPRLSSGPLREQLGTPLGKLTLIQGAALAVLVVFVGSTVQGKRVSIAPAAQANASGGYRQYLPVAANVTTVAATTKLADAATPLALAVWATPWNINTLSGSGKSFRSVSAFWGTVASDGVSIQPKADWTAWDTYVGQQPSGHPTYYLTVSGDPNLTSVMLADPVKRQQHVKNLLTIAQQHGFDGIDIDYEALGRENRDPFSVFIEDLTSQFHSAHKQVAVTVEARIGSDVPMDWYKLGRTADEVRVMAYDYHGRTTGTPGPIAPIGWLQEILQYAQSNVAHDKLIMGIGDYGYDWQQGTDGSWSGAGLTRDQAAALARKYNQPVVRQTGIDPRGYDIGSIPEFAYTDGEGNKHDVWFEDAQSLQAKETLVSQYHPAGVIFWTIGLTGPS